MEAGEVSGGEALSSAVPHLACNREGLVVVLQRFRAVALFPMDDREVSEVEALLSAIAHFAGDRDGLLEVLQRLGIAACQIQQPPRTAK